jgi:DNA polymerase delta subunit 1
MVTFQAVAWDGGDIDEKYTVRVFGRTEDGRSVSLGTTFEPFCYVKPPAGKVSGALSFVRTKCASVEARKSIDLWGFRNGTLEDFLLVRFKSHKGLRNFAWCIENRKWPELSGCTVHESNIDPVLRFMHVTGIASTGWLESGTCEMDPETTCDLNLWQAKWQNFRPVARDDIAPLKVMSFDIECYSSTGAFPNPNNPADVVFQIGMTTRSFGTDVVEKKCLCLKETAGYDSYKTERDLLMAFENYLIKTDPDIITGWNIFGFDLEFLIVRATRLGIEPVWGRVKDSVAELTVKMLSSSALGNNELKLVPMKGRYVFDLFQDVKREHKLESYSLNNVSKHFLKDQKNDMPVKEIFSRFAEGDPKRLGEVADYCIQDTVLPHKLMDKLCQLQNQIEMAKACWVPLSFLSERGQQIKVFSQMAYKARQLNFIIPTFKKSGLPVSDEGYEGATVLDAQAGAYYNPITALDFASLYPSIMCAHNLCYSTLVMDPKYDNLPGVTYEQFGSHKFAQNVQSLLPTILTDLKAFRKKAKKLMAQAEGTPMEAVYNGQQLAYKISMNSMYGFTGASKGMLPLVAIASTVTMRGRQMIEETKNYVEANFPGAKVRYGDSVMPETPVLVKIDGVCHPVKIENLAKTWESYPGFIKDGMDKESSEVSGIEAWTHDGWQPIKRVIRHKCSKKIYRVLTHTGVVDVTEDHSLLGPNIELLKPKDVMIGQKLFHSFPKDISTLFVDKIYINGGEKLLKMFDGDIDLIRFTFDMSDSAITLQQKFPKHTIRIQSQIEAQIIYTRLSQLGFKNISLNSYKDCIQIIFSNRASVLFPTAIKKIEILHESWDGYVYDLETDAGTFQAGVGQMIVKNTDSVMVEFDVQGRKGQDAIDYSWEQGELAAAQCTKLFKAPNDLELEKVYCPYFLYSKKRYAAKMYEKAKDGTVKFKKIDVKGLQVVRRDSCPYVRETLKTLLNMILESNDPRPVIEAAREAARNLMQGKVPMEKLLLSKQLASDYKVRMAHVEVRDKMRAREPGSEPQQGDRVSFLIVQGPGKMYEKAEDPVWVREKNVPIDYSYYFTNQMKKPIQDLLEPLIPPATIFNKKFMVKTESTVEMDARKAFLARFARTAS